jgi:hypothetical protein
MAEMAMDMFALLLLGGAGAAIALGIAYMVGRRPAKKFSAKRFCLTIVGLAIVTSVYFSLVDKAPSSMLTPVLYGLFLGFLVEKIVDGRGTPAQVKKTNDLVLPSASYSFFVAPSQSAAGTAPSVMVLVGFLPVFSVGCLGGVVAAVGQIAQGEGKFSNLRPVSILYWCIAILAGGAITAFNGIDHVNALTAFQLGMTGPLIPRLAPRRADS